MLCMLFQFGSVLSDHFLHLIKQFLAHDGSCILGNESTLDEAPMAYKSLEDIIDVVRESVDVIDVLRPIYNFKASE